MGSYEAKKHAKRLLNTFKASNTFWNTVETIQTKQKELEVKKIEAVQSVFDEAISYTEEVFATAIENLKNEKKRSSAEFLKDKAPLRRVVTPRKESLSEYTAGSAKLLDQTNKDIFSDEEEVEESTSSKKAHNNSKQKRCQTRYGRDIPDYSEQGSDQEYKPEKRVCITRPDSRSHHAGKGDKPEIDNGKFEENYDEKTELFFESSDISTIQD
ncbi:6879_t:CDS:2 [Ambispora leptoticha]|uniref:6879_t:CDS:1 n=1 Tax=Ambispora leptoticha TaxID=144679 RepID=A0A9N9CVE7_9GLOM|nr:6879_t:CDS:2 [Ambispora leptoticha]